MDKDYLLLTRASASRPSGDWSDDDFDVRVKGEVVGRIYKAMLRRSARLGCGHSRSGTTKVARRRMGMLRPARLRWQPLPRAGGENNVKANED